MGKLIPPSPFNHLTCYFVRVCDEYRFVLSFPFPPVPSSWVAKWVANLAPQTWLNMPVDPIIMATLPAADLAACDDEAA